MKYISRLTALLLALLMLISSAGAEMSIDDLTLGELDALYSSTGEEEYIFWEGDILGLWLQIDAFAAVTDKDQYTYQWYDQDGNAVAATSETEPYTLVVYYTLTEQQFYCVATDDDGETFQSEINVIDPAQTTDLEAYLSYLYDDMFYNEDGSRNHAATYQMMHDFWNVETDGGNLAQNLVDAWQAEKDTDIYDHELFCYCVVSGAVSADFCMLEPEAVHDASCAWYVAQKVLEDEDTGIRVTGDIPEDVTLQVTAAAGPVPEMDTRHFNALRNYPIITGYNITLLNEDGSEYEVPEGTSVRVIIPNAWLADMEYPVVDVYHVKDNGEVVYLTSQLNEVVLCDDYSVEFETDGFSEYWITSGSKYTDYFQNGSSHVFYMVPGTEAQVGSYKWLYEQQPGNSWIKAESTNPTVVSTSETDGTIYISAAADAQPDQDNAAAVVTISWHGWDWIESATVTVYIISEEEKEEINYQDKLDNQGYPVQLTIRTDGTIPNEPCVWDGVAYTYFKKSNSGELVVCGSDENLAGTAKDIINPNIFDHELFYFVSRDGKPVIGLVDPTGEAIKSLLTGIDWDSMMEAAATAGSIYGTNSSGQKELITADNYQDYHVVPYVVKCQETDGKGWHIDCAVVRNGAVHLSYDLNIPDGMTIVTQGVTPPNNQTGTAPAEFTVDKITGMTDGTYITVSPDYKFEFVEWNTREDGSGIAYDPDDEITINEDTTLYAVWKITPELGTGNLKVRKVVEDEAASGSQEFTFSVAIPAEEDGTYGEYDYILYGADNLAVRDEEGKVVGGKISNGGTFALKNGQYVIITGLPIAVKAEGAETYTPNITVTETVSGDYTPAWTGGTASGTSAAIAIRDGSLSELTCTNTKAASSSTLTVIKEGMQDGESAVIRVEVNGQTYMLALSSVHASDTIINLPIGSSYTVTELNAWTWLYDDQSAQTGSIAQNGSVVTITNTAEDDKWLHDESSVINNLKDGSTTPINNQ